MSAYLTLTRRELAAFFLSLSGYVTIAAVVLLMGLSFTTMLTQLQNQANDAPITQLYYMTPYFWFVLLLAGPVITMRLFALEKYSGTFETLMTAPVSDRQVVLAKFTAAMIYYIVMWVPSQVCMLVLRRFMTDTQAFDGGLFGSTMLGLFLLGCLFISAGCFASALTRNQITAAMISFALGFSLFIVSFVADRATSLPDWVRAVVSQVAIEEQMQDFSRGTIDTRHIVFYVTMTVMFLFLTLRVVESRRWK
jgi:ABC-2 type transport system permease protein